ncbi:GNAT family N-acetyltransferase [Achromobacter seleniivolatilans]|uniref:GNAT family N-acetyltransferase n=1 Tax=Achromobacter seleniivolatilans TaxID=3047478 RepID=A0ABY9M854_9BURK|nr:GNAT family N-acetyltransferase [Achromobacter sp. R39]WMD23199.1 GNAT family N-acetyltransferase [Achromobacter sp. R39]
MNTGPLISDFPSAGLSTGRLLLRKADASHAKSVQAYLVQNRAYLQTWEPLRNEAFFELNAVKQRLNAMASATARGDALHLLFFSSENGKLSAACNFTNIVRGPFQACHLGYSIAEPLQGLGLMHEGLTAAITHVFQKMKLHRIMANYRPENTRSARLLARLGFQREGLAHSYLNINGAWSDHILTALINPADT